MKSVLSGFIDFYRQSRAEGQGVIESIESALLLGAGAITRRQEEGDEDAEDASPPAPAGES